MAAPTLDKTWQFNVNQDLNTTGNGSVDRQRLLRMTKNAMIGFASNPWVVAGSSDGATAGMDGVDRWTSNASLQWGAGAHAWIVLAQAGLGANVQLLIDLGFSTADRITASLSVGAAGFTGGSTTAPPTAPDATAQLARGSRWFWGDDLTSFNCALHVMQSTDGQCTRVVAFHNTLPKMLLQLERVRSPIPALTDPVFAAWFGRYTFQGSEVKDAPCWYFYQHALGNPFGDAEPFRAGTVRQASADLNVSFLCECAGAGPSATIPQRGARLNQIEAGTYALAPCVLLSEVPGARGFLGGLHDLWWGDENAPSGRGYPTDAAPDFVHIRNAVVPWNGTVLLTA